MILFDKQPPFWSKPKFDSDKETVKMLIFEEKSPNQNQHTNYVPPRQKFGKQRRSQITSAKGSKLDSLSWRLSCKGETSITQWEQKQTFHNRCNSWHQDLKTWGTKLISMMHPNIDDKQMFFWLKLSWRKLFSEFVPLFCTSAVQELSSLIFHAMKLRLLCWPNRLLLAPTPCVSVLPWYLETGSVIKKSFLLILFQSTWWFPSGSIPRQWHVFLMFQRYLIPFQPHFFHNFEKLKERTQISVKTHLRKVQQCITVRSVPLCKKWSIVLWEALKMDWTDTQTWFNLLNTRARNTRFDAAEPQIPVETSFIKHTSLRSADVGGAAQSVRNFYLFRKKAERLTYLDVLQHVIRIAIFHVDLASLRNLNLHCKTRTWSLEINTKQGLWQPLLWFTVDKKLFAFFLDVPVHRSEFNWASIMEKNISATKAWSC